MSLYGALASGVSGINAFSNEMAIRADNISNISTIGYKKGKADFSTLVSEIEGNSINYASGGVTAKYRALIDIPGTILSSDSASDIAVNGAGFFVVNNKTDGTGDTLYTRAGSFRSDAKGAFVNSAGYTLMGWPLDNENRLPGDNGNVNRTPSSLIASLAPVNVKSITGSASPTSSIVIGANLNESQAIMKGSGEIISFSANSVANYNISSTDPISPENSTPNIMNIGDIITLTPSSTGTPYNFVFGGVSRSNDIGGGILGSTNAQGTFISAVDGQQFKVTSAGTTSTYTYRTTNPVASKGEFNTPENLSAAINQSVSLKSRIVSDGTSTRIIITPIDANTAMTFTDVSGTFAASLGFANTTSAALGNRFSSLDGLSKLINKTSGASSDISNAIQNASLNFYATDPTGKLTVSASGSTVGSVTSTPSSVLAELGLNTTNNQIFGPAYDSTNSSLNMASGAVSPHFSRNIQVYDAFGTSHIIEISFAKTAINTWAVEVFTQTPSELVISRTDGQLAAGTISFNGDGSLQIVSPNLTNPIGINWSNKSIPSFITINWGTAGSVEGTLGAQSIGKTDGLRQVDAEYNVDFVEQNGIPSGLLTGVSFDELGNVIASFSNGSSKNIFRLPVAEFSNPNGLQNRGGNAYVATNNSGSFELKSAGEGGAGKIASGALEQSNVDLADELTSVIITQRNYQSASKIIKVTDSMLEDLNRLIT